MHEVPGQQSALLVQPPHAGTHAVLPQTNRGVPPSEAEFGTHGTPPQQLALDAQPPPASTHAEGAQRGTPTLSCLQVSWWQLPAQQSQEALQLMVASLHTSPSGLHDIGLRQTPGLVAVAPTQVTLP
jgi:hypothetical protein